MADNRSNKDEPDVYKQADEDGQFRRKPSVFRDFISSKPGAKFPAEKDRYALYIAVVCPWAHRTWITLQLKGLTDIIQLFFAASTLTPDGWTFEGQGSHYPQEPLYGFKNTKELYLKADPSYTGRYTVPILWDKKTETIVNNESSEIIRMLYTEFDAFLPEPLRESSKLARDGGGLLPPSLLPEIDSMNSWIYDTINNGVYKTGFATTQQAYESHVYPLFASLDRVEHHLASSSRSKPKYLFGPHITDTDIRLYTTIARFDVAYHSLFKCNLKMIRYDYPHIHTWFRTLYWDTTGPETNGGAFHNTTRFTEYKFAYARALGSKMMNAEGNIVVPAGPVPDVLPL